MRGAQCPNDIDLGHAHLGLNDLGEVQRPARDRVLSLERVMVSQYSGMFFQEINVLALKCRVLVSQRLVFSREIDEPAHVPVGKFLLRLTCNRG